MRELLTKCNRCESDGFYCSYSMEYFRGLHNKNLILDHCADIRRAFRCGFVSTPEEGPKGFLGKQGTCEDLRSMYSYKGCPMDCNPTTTTSPPAPTGCKGSCQAGTCDGFVRLYGVTCSALEANGCDCSGCTRCTDAKPKNYAIKVGLKC